MAALKITLVLLILGSLAGTFYWLWTPDKSRAELEKLYLRSANDMIDILGTRLHVRDQGPKDAPAVVMLHGFGSNLQTWDVWADALQADFRVIRLDLAGAGLSPPDATGDYSDGRSIALLVALMEHLNISEVSVVGNSIGGRIAWRFAAAHPRKVAKLVLVSPDGFASPGFEYGKAPDVPMLAGLMRYTLPKILLKWNLAQAYSDPEKLTTPTVTRYHDLLLAPGVRNATLERMAQTVLEAPEPLLRKLQMPVLLVWGEDDAMIPISNADDYLRNLPNATLVRLAGVGHVPQEEAAEQSLVAVRRFLSD